MFAHGLLKHSLDISSMPPPPIDDSFPHPTLLEQTRVTDAHRVQQFLTATKAGIDQHDGKACRSIVPVNISTYRAELCEALNVLENLKHSKLVLDDLLQEAESGETWNEELNRAGQLKEVLGKMLEALENVKRKQSLHRKLSARRKKRAWLKRRNQRLHANRLAEQTARTQRSQEIANWEAEWKDRLTQERVAREEQQMKTLILTDVRRRKARAKRMLARFEKSLHLHQQRQNVSTVNTQPEVRFDARMYALIAEWRGKVDECVKEEKRLKDILNRQSTGNVSRRRENRWRKVLFGTAAIGGMFGRQSKDWWWQELVAVRRAWDKFSLPADPNHPFHLQGTVNTWNVPPEKPSPEWEVYRETSKIKRCS
ncbi:programmed cell death protein 7 isoform X1 [Anopheles stephensi]|uniref:programmed cell death protein 7 isoform X1 n=1 Tax=Anopheles stephensi TaxID=30069 RepID=UPI001658BA71|nr:programmed cell death protein 7 isoform X1 [Anopheles stephensi]